MSKQLTTQIYELDSYPISKKNGLYGGQAGSKEGIVINGDNWLVKYPKSTKGMTRIGTLSYTTSPLSEYIGSHIYDILNYDVHNTILGVRNNKLVVACKDFCTETKQLQEIRVIKNVYNEQLEEELETELSSTRSTHMVDLKELMIHLEYNPILKNIKGLKKRFWDCVIIDGIINNNDRNNGNWGLLYDGNTFELAPVFDNGASFSNKLPEEKLDDLLINPSKMKQSSLYCDTTFGINDKRLTYRKLLDLNIPEMDEAIKRTVPLFISKFADIKSFINYIPNEYNEIQVCSENRKKVYIQGMELRVQYLLMPKYEKILESESDLSDETEDENDFSM